MISKFLFTFTAAAVAVFLTVAASCMLVWVSREAVKIIRNPKEPKGREYMWVFSQLSRCLFYWESY